MIASCKQNFLFQVTAPSPLRVEKNALLHFSSIETEQITTFSDTKNSFDSYLEQAKMCEELKELSLNNKQNYT